MRIVFLNGSEFRGSWNDLVRALWHPLFISLVMAVVAVILVLRPYDRFMPEGVVIRTLIVASSVMVFIACLLICAAQSRRLPLFVSTLPILACSVCVSSFWGVGISMVAGGNGLGLTAWVQLLAFNMVLSTVAEIFLASFLLERIATETGLKAQPIIAFAQDSLEPSQSAAPLAKDGADAKKLAIGVPIWCEILGHRLAVDTIWHLKAEEHYVSVALHDGRALLLRGRLLDAINQLPETAGRQVHRSHWVANAALAGLQRKREGWRLQLHNMQEVPVARNRQSEVRDWAERLLKS